MIDIPLRPIAACMGKWKPADSAAQGAVTGAGLQVPDRLTISPLDEPTVRRTHRETMRIMLLAAAAGLSLAASTAAYADGGDGPPPTRCLLSCPVSLPKLMCRMLQPMPRTGRPWEPVRHIGAPWQTPNFGTRHAGINCNRTRCRHSDIRMVLDVLGKNQWSRLKYQNAVIEEFVAVEEVLR